MMIMIHLYFAAAAINALMMTARGSNEHHPPHHQQPHHHHQPHQHQQQQHPFIFGVNYDPAHHEAFPVYRRGDTSSLRQILVEDFEHMKKQNFTVVKTFFSRFYDYDVAPVARDVGMKLYLGVHLTNADWGREQIEAAKRAMAFCPDLIQAIVVGNEDLNLKSDHSGHMSAQRIIHVMNELKHHRNHLGLDQIPIGTSQRINEWLLHHPDVVLLAQSSDYIGVTIYPFFSQGYDPTEPMRLLDLQWNQMKAQYPHHRLVLMETGFPSAGSAPRRFASDANHVPSVSKAHQYYQALTRWHRADRFVFMMYDRHPDDPFFAHHHRAQHRHTSSSSSSSYEQFFGLFSRHRAPKWHW